MRRGRKTAGASSSGQEGGAALSAKAGCARVAEAVGVVQRPLDAHAHTLTRTCTPPEAQA
jgi:hypothetical protein